MGRRFVVRPRLRRRSLARTIHPVVVSDGRRLTAHVYERRHRRRPANIGSARKSRQWPRAMAGWHFMANGKFVSYLRVSTDKQGRSGLGLEAQRDAVASYLNGAKRRLVAEYVETESGKRADRPQAPASTSLWAAASYHGQGQSTASYFRVWHFLRIVSRGGMSS
jgi:hypothetical protein